MLSGLSLSRFDERIINYPRRASAVRESLSRRENSVYKRCLGCGALSLVRGRRRDGEARIGKIVTVRPDIASPSINPSIFLHFLIFIVQRIFVQISIVNILGELNIDDARERNLIPRETIALSIRRSDDRRNDQSLEIARRLANKRMPDE